MANGIGDRMVRAAKLESDLYEEVEHDTRATPQAALVVVLVSIASGIGTGIGGILDDKGAIWFLWGLLFGIFTSLIGWLIWAFITRWIGGTIFRTAETEVDYGQMLRTLGFAQSPGVLRILGFIPVLGWIINFFVWIWILFAGVIAVRQAMDFSTGRAIATVIVG